MVSAVDVLAPLDWQAESDSLYWLLYPELMAAAEVGGTAALLDLASKGMPAMGVAWGQINDAAAAWAEAHCAQLVKEVTTTTQDQLRTAVSAFHATPGMNRGELERLIMNGPDGIQGLQIPGRYFSAQDRAQMIATTEVTRSYTSGNMEAIKALGMSQVDPKEQPPAHVNCRCSIEAFTRDDGVTSWQWHTLNDELVCDICGPLNGKDVGEASPAQEQAEKPEAKPEFWTEGDARYAAGSVDKLTSRSRAWFDGLTDTEREAVAKWSGNWQPIRERIRNGEIGDTERALLSAIEQAPRVTDRLVWRGVNPGSVFQSAADIRAGYERGTGTVIEWDTLSSASIAPDVAAEFGNTVFEISSTRARYINAGSKYFGKGDDDELEAIFLPGSKFRIVGVKKGTVEMVYGERERYFIQLEDVTE